MATKLRRVEPTAEDRRMSVELHRWPILGNLQGIEGDIRVKTRTDGLIFFRNLLDSLVIFSQELAKLQMAITQSSTPRSRNLRR